MRAILFSCLLLSQATVSSGQQSDSVEHVDLDTIKVSVPAGAVPYQPSATRVWNILHTRVALSFDRKERTAAAREWLRLTPYFYSTDTVRLDAKGMKIDSVCMVVGKTLKAVPFTYTNDVLLVRPGKEYSRKDTLNLYLRYTSMPYARKSEGSAAIQDDKGLYFINTDGREPAKEAHIWTQGETESNSHWMVTIDKPNTRFTTEIELTVPDSLTTLSNGAMVKQTRLPGGMRTDVWRMDKPIQAYAVMFAIGHYAVAKDSWNGKEVNYYVEPAYAPYAKHMFKNTPEMIGYFSRRTGVPFPWNKYSQVVVRDYVSGAMENTSASLFGEFMNLTDREMEDKSNEDIVSHELFHQWFGDYVTAESWSNLTVNESFANYGEQLWRYGKYGAVQGDILAWDDLRKYLMSTMGKDPQLVRFQYDDKEEMFDAISYNKGGAILHYLNTLIGDEAFDRAMNLYLTRNALSSGEAHQWRLAVEEATGQDWNWFFNEWYFHGGHPVLKVTYDYDDAAQQLNVAVTQAQEDSTMVYDMPLATSVYYGNTPTVEQWRITHKEEHYSYPYKAGQLPLIIPDMHHVLPGSITEHKTPTEWWRQMQVATDYVSKWQAVQGASKKMSDSLSGEILNLALSDKIPEIRAYALETIKRIASERKQRRWMDAVLLAANKDTSNKVRSAAYDVLYSWNAKNTLEQCLKGVGDRSYLVASSALDAVAKLDADTAYAVAHKLLTGDIDAQLERTVWQLIGKQGNVADAGLMSAHARKLVGGPKTSFSFSLSDYIKTCSDAAAAQQAGDALVYMTIHETSKNTRSATGGSYFQAIRSLKQDAEDTGNANHEVAAKKVAQLKAGAQELVAKEDDEAVRERFEKLYKELYAE